MTDVWTLAALWLGLALIATLFAIWFRVSTALTEIIVGTVAQFILGGHPVRDIVDIARDLKADLLVVGASGHSALHDRMIGSRADRIMHLAPCPVLVVKMTTRLLINPFQNIIR